MKKGNKATIKSNYTGIAFAVGQTVKYLGLKLGGHKFQALKKDEGQQFKKEQWVELEQVTFEN